MRFLPSLAIAALLGACTFDQAAPLETGVFYDDYVTSPDLAQGWANAYCAQYSRLAVFKDEGLIDGRRAAAFQCLVPPVCADEGIPETAVIRTAADTWQTAVTCKTNRGVVPVDDLQF
jgi:hypothetical protein